MIQIENISKLYGKHTALDELSFTINKGEILGLLGPNGAGKSTTMNIMTGYIAPTEGSVIVDGINLSDEPDKVKGKIGYLPEMPPLYVDMSVLEYLVFVSKLKKVKKETITDSLEKIMDLVKISHVKNRFIKNLSKGYKQRVGLAQAIIGEPDVLILDEPTVGLDPKEIIEIRKLIKNLGKEHTVILSSHILSEISAVCDRVIIINKGKIVATGTPEELSSKMSLGNKLVLRVKGDETAVIEAVNGIEGVKNVINDGVNEEGTIDITIDVTEKSDIREILVKKLSDEGMSILMMKNIDITLEDIFLELTNTNEGEA